MKEKYMTEQEKIYHLQFLEAIEVIKDLYKNCDFIHWKTEDFLNKIEK